MTSMRVRTFSMYDLIKKILRLFFKDWSSRKTEFVSYRDCLESFSNVLDKSVYFEAKGSNYC